MLNLVRVSYCAHGFHAFQDSATVHFKRACHARSSWAVRGNF
jgi:hypothetical protein